MASVINASSSGAGGLVSSGDSSGVLQLQNNGSTSVTLDTSGNVGIGTTSPASKLHVYGATDSKLTLQNSNNSCFVANLSGSMYVQSADIIGFNTGGATERMRIDSSGNLLVGFTSANAGNSQAGSIQTGTGVNLASQYTKKPFLMADYSNSTAGIPQYVGNGPGPYWSIGTNNTTNSDIRIGLCNSGSSGFSWSGTYPALFSGAYTNASDYRIKENVTTYSDGALNQVLALRPITYKIKDSEHTKGEETVTVVGKEEIGFLAHEIQAIIPLVVTGTKDEVDSNGNEVHQGVDYTRLTAVLTKAIQELKAINDTQAETLTQQTEAINALTARIVALEGK